MFPIIIAFVSVFVFLLSIHLLETSAEEQPTILSLNLKFQLWIFTKGLFNHSERLTKYHSNDWSLSVDADPA